MPAWLKPDVSRKSGSVIVTRSMRENARRNCERYPWAKALRDRLARRVKRYVEMSDEELWWLPPAQEMPRSSATDNPRGSGCPKCGKEHFNAPYNPSRWHWDFVDHPWQMQCRNCGEWFPKNDFAAYYRTALDEHGKFRLGKGDPRFLKPKEPGANPQWVDDGTGIKVGGKKFFIAAFYAFQLWTELLDVTEDLATLYTLTGDRLYAHKAAVLLDRMADLYPEMDYTPHYRLGMEASTGGSGKGRIQGCIWETWTAQKLSLAYDYVYDALMEDEELVRFSSEMSRRYGTGDKSSPRAIATHIENHLIREFIVGVLDGRIRGNVGMHQYSMTAAAVALDHPRTTPRCLDWLFEPDGGAIPTILVEVISREGFSHESGLGYASIPGKSFAKVAELIRHYKAYTKHDLYRDYPKFRNCFTMCAKVRACDRFFPNWGDSNKCMNIGTTGLTIPVEMALAGYRVYGGREIAREVWFANGKKLEGLKLNVYDAEPEAILERLRKDLAPELSGKLPPLRSYNTSGYGCAFLQAPSREHGRCIMLYYGRMIAHGHEDRLAIQMVSNDVVSIPDLGYPLYTGSWPKRVGWTSHVISHNTVMVNDKGPRRAGSYSGRTRLFGDVGFLRVADVDGEGQKIYDGVRTYRRCLVMVDVDDAHSYVLDIFWVRGGKNHRLIQNGGGPEITQSGLKLVEQPRGTYAGEDVEYGEFYDGPANWDYDGSGFMYLKRVSRARPEGDFWVDWKIVEPRRTMPPDWEAHVRVHNLTQVDEVAVCDGIPPEYKGNPPVLRYVLRTRFGEDLNTQFVSVIEPYGKTPLIRNVRALENSISSRNAVAAVEVSLADGRRDILIVTENGGRVDAGGVHLNGRVGFVRYRADRPVLAALIDGTSLSGRDVRLRLPAAAATGRLAGWDDSDPADVRLRFALPVRREGIEGKYIIFQNRERSDACYRIERVIDARTVSIGANSLVERFKDPRDYSKGVVTTIAPRDPFRVPLAAVWRPTQ